MTNPNKRKGDDWERDVMRAFRAAGIQAVRPRQEGTVDEDGTSTDVGDLHGLSPFVGQCKAYANVANALRDGLEGANRQARKAGEPYGVTFVKRPRKGVWDGYAPLSMAAFLRVLVRLRRAERLVLRWAPAAARDNHFHLTALEAETHPSEWLSKLRPEGSPDAQ